MHCLYPRDSQQRVPDAGVADSGGHGLHEDGEDVPQNWTGGPQHHDATYTCGDRISYGVLRLGVDHT